MSTPIVLFLAALLFFAAYLLFNTMRISRPPAQVETPPLPHVDGERAARRLSEAVRIPTVSKQVMSEEDLKPFKELHTWVEQTYPRVFSSLEKRVINGHSLLMRWKGQNTKLQPALFFAHMDVVPVDEARIKDWHHQPFSGEISDGNIWGRGAMDMKGQLIAILEAVDTLLAEGYTPQRTFYLAFGHDEEIMGFKGAKAIVEHLKNEGVTLAALLDEGGSIMVDTIPGVNVPVALVGVAEKGYLTVNISAEATGGHSSTPPRQSAVGVVARALALIDDAQLPARLDFMKQSFMPIAFLLPFINQLALANSWLFKPLLVRLMEKKPSTNALIRTTKASTMISGGIKDNVLPSKVEAKVNCRLLPGETVDGMLEFFKRVIQDPRVKIEIDNGLGWEASAISPTDTSPYRTLELVIRQVFNGIPVTPTIMLGGTDSRHFQPVCRNIYKFAPYVVNPEILKGMHGIDERMSKESLEKMVAFFMRLARVWGDAEF